jgi:hypothetical protein
MKKVLIVMMLSCICFAIANTDHRPVQTNIDELARGQPTAIVGVVADNVIAPMPSVIVTNRKTRDVDVSRYSNYNYIKSSKNVIAGNKTSPKYPDRVGWRS